jgi:tRNA pseudouridine(55) synthase
MMLLMQKYITLEKLVGETPLSCAEDYRTKHAELEGVPMAYAGRLDPMASGKLLILLGEECKNQEKYHSLDKEYEFSVLFGIESDSLDVLGRLATCTTADPNHNDSDKSDLSQILESLTGHIELPYPRFSAKTVQGKPLHMWTLEGRLDEIEIPTRTSTIYSMNLIKTETLPRTKIANLARIKIDTIPPVTELRKALGNDFRRVDVRADWEHVAVDESLPAEYTIATFSCLASSGTYMRTLASVIAKKLDTCGLAWSIHRNKVGIYNIQQNSWTIEY